MTYDLKKIGDFKRYYDSSQKRNYWVLGYFGGGAVNIVDAYNLALQFAATIKVPVETVKIDEILKSRRHKGFKFMYSSELNQIPEENSEVMENVYAWLTD